MLAYTRSGIVLAAVFCLAGAVHAQPDKDGVPFGETDQGRATQVASLMVGAGDFLGAIGARVLASEDIALAERVPGWKFDFDVVVPIYYRYLAAIRDNRPLPVIEIDTTEKLARNKPLPEFWEKKGPDWAWYMAYNDALRRSHEATLERFKKSAEPNEDLLYPDLKAQPRLHRGKVITVKGKLVVIRRMDGPRYVPPELTKIYTGYIIGPTKGAPPFTVVFTELPAGVTEPSESFDREVTFYGYFLSLVRFDADKKGSKKQDDLIFSPYLVGKTPIVHPRKVEAQQPFTYYLVVSALGAIVVVAIVVAALNFMLRRSDRAIQARLAEMRNKSQPFAVEPAEPEPPLAAPVKPNEEPPAG
jgi:hypothetical protein